MKTIRQPLASTSANIKTGTPKTDFETPAVMKSTFLILFLACVIFTSLAFRKGNSPYQVKLGSEIEAERNAEKGILFGIQLRPQAIKLLRLVEKAYGKKIKQLISPKSDAITGGLASVDKDGTPIIQINDKIGRREDIIVHELFHLKQISAGYRLCEYKSLADFPSDDKIGPALNVLNVVIGPWLRDQILHSLFFPEMSKMGFDPAPEVRKLWKDTIENDGLKNFNSANGSIALPILYFQAATQLDDPKLIKEITDFYVSRNWQEPLKRGTEMVNQFHASKPLTPEKELSFFLYCANLALKNYLTLSLEKDSIEEKGNFQQHIGQIKVTWSRSK